tara:strand:- start:313 stop:624 length:312 start_codon:yes stop_codon:yes gene_type:complete
MENMIVSNFINDQYIDRIYISFNKQPYLVLKNGKQFEGKIKELKIKGKKYFLTNNNKWFDNCGLPINAPEDTKEELNKFKNEIKKDEEEKRYIQLKNKILNAK